VWWHAARHGGGALIPRARLGLVAVIAAGVFVGVGAYAFVYARGASYLTNDPAACANCHVMNEHYTGWLRGSHRSAAVCNDCHTPANPALKYVTKASNGFWHSFAFTTGRFPDEIRITPRNHRIAEESCLKCHGELVDPLVHAASGSVSCLQCHSQAGHMR
jgi:cytochrome c nitrite reductase small subunit